MFASPPRTPGSFGASVWANAKLDQRAMILPATTLETDLPFIVICTLHSRDKSGWPRRIRSTQSNSTLGPGGVQSSTTGFLRISLTALGITQFFTLNKEPSANPRVVKSSPCRVDSLLRIAVKNGRAHLIPYENGLRNETENQIFAKSWVRR